MCCKKFQNPLNLLSFVPLDVVNSQHIVHPLVSNVLFLSDRPRLRYVTLEALIHYRNLWKELPKKIKSYDLDRWNV